MNLKNKFKTYLPTLRGKLIDEDSNKRIVGFCTYFIMCAVSLVMTVINIVTHKGWLTFATGVFSLLCVVDILLLMFYKKGARIASVMFSVEFIAMFTFFLITGNPEGFSALWILLIPSLGMLFYGRERATLLSLVMLAELIFFLWIPFGKSLLMYEYNDTFRMRFPVLYIAFYVLSLFLETLRLYTYNEMTVLQKRYKELSIKDQLTEIYNRQGMYSAVREAGDKRRYEKVGALIFDLDHFKEVNDTYGHGVGDEILKEFASMMKNELDVIPCRWGGEEFSAIWFDDDIGFDDVEKFRRLVEKHIFRVEDYEIRITVSGGMYESMLHSANEVDILVRQADKALYEAKNSGRNKIVCL